MWKLVLKAAKYAKKAHGNQKRAHGAPYFLHPLAVARLLWKHGHKEPALLAAAYLHDTMEDCGVSFASMEQAFGSEVAALVEAVTKREGESPEAYFARVKAAGPLAIALKRADRTHNNSELHLLPPEKEYMREKAMKKTAAMELAFAS